MKKKSLELKKLTLKKGTIASLSQQARIVGGATFADTACCLTNTCPSSPCDCQPTEAPNCTVTLRNCTAETCIVNCTAPSVGMVCR